LDCGGQPSVTPLLHPRAGSKHSTTVVRSKAVSPLRPATALVNDQAAGRLVWFRRRAGPGLGEIEKLDDGSKVAAVKIIFNPANKIETSTR